MGRKVKQVFGQTFYSKPINKLAALGVSYNIPSYLSEQTANEEVRLRVYSRLNSLFDSLDQVIYSSTPPLMQCSDKIAKRLRKTLKAKIRKEIGKKPETVKKSICKQTIDIKARELFQVKLQKKRENLQAEIDSRRIRNCDRIMNIIFDSIRNDSADVSKFVFNAFVNRCEFEFNRRKLTADLSALIEKIVNSVEKDNKIDLYRENLIRLQKLMHR
ncbi:MAG: hypothetical protein A2Y97_01235 [Nitrospirae bacterium RBG_13_39_12]|nr:MAG: hypothetical protein A2Y97_01235 [Nitrospirae bacterium RBG_13_39_12]